MSITVYIPKIGAVVADSVPDLIARVRKEIDERGYGASDVGAKWPIKAGTGEVLGSLSYNGRFQSQSTPTPGPWYFQNGVVMPDGDTFVDKDGATVYRGERGKEPVAQLIRNHADGPLLAAVPEMVEALQYILRINGSTSGAKSMVKEFKYRATIALTKAGVI
jgi:hypothetical protein